MRVSLICSSNGERFHCTVTDTWLTLRMRNAVVNGEVAAGWAETFSIGTLSGPPAQCNTMDTSEDGSTSGPITEMTSDDITFMRRRDTRDDFLEISETPQVCIFPRSIPCVLCDSSSPRTDSAVCCVWGWGCGRVLLLCGYGRAVSHERSTGDWRLRPIQTRWVF